MPKGPLRRWVRITILVALVVWLALLGIAVVGPSVGAPDVVARVAVVVWAAAALFLAPATWLLRLLVEVDIGPGSKYAIRMAPYSLLVGSAAVLVGALLLVPSPSTTVALHITGAVAVAWGGFVLFGGVIALRKKRRQQNAARS